MVQGRKRRKKESMKNKIKVEDLSKGVKEAHANKREQRIGAKMRE